MISIFPCALSQISNHTSPQGDVCTRATGVKRKTSYSPKLEWPWFTAAKTRICNHDHDCRNVFRLRVLIKITTKCSSGGYWQRLLQWVQVEGLGPQLEKIQSELSLCEKVQKNSMRKNKNLLKINFKALAEYLETKRLAFPRSDFSFTFCWESLDQSLAARSSLKY